LKSIPFGGLLGVSTGLRACGDISSTFPYFWLAHRVRWSKGEILY